MFLESGKLIFDKIRSSIEQHESSTGPIRIAVAFWGKGAEEVFKEFPNKEFHLICNLRMGGTNPNTIKIITSLPNVTVKHSDTLHAKVCLANQVAIVSSANFSINGLGLELSDLSTWTEAGARLDKESGMMDVFVWFNNLWQSCKEISQKDLDLACDAWNKKKSFEKQSFTQQPERTVYPKLDEHIIFNETGNRNNALKAGHKSLLKSYRQMTRSDGVSNDGYLCAYVANLLYVCSGNSVEWKDGKFSSPSQVVERWRSIKKVNDQQVFEFLYWIVDDENIHKSIRSAAKLLVENDWDDIVSE